jgi:type II secretory pathway component GspD/PulD (secretin)
MRAENRWRRVLLLCAAASVAAVAGRWSVGEEPPAPPAADAPKKPANPYLVPAEKPAEPKPAELKPDPDADDEPETKPAAKPEPKPETKSAAKPEPKREPKVEPAPAPPVVPGKGEPPPPPPPPPAVKPVARPAPAPAASATPDGKVRFVWKDADIEAVFKFLEHALNIPIYRQQVQLPAFRVTITNDKPVTLDEALDVFNAVLQTQGFAIIDRRPKFLQLVALDKVKNADIPVMLQDPKPGQLKDTSRVLRAVFSVKGDDGAALAVNLRSLVSAWGDLTHNKASNTLTVLDTEERIRAFAAYLERISETAGTADLKTYRLDHIEAYEAAEVLKSVLSAGGAAAARPSGNPYARLGAGDPNAAAAGAGADRNTFHVVPDGRTRQLLVRGTPDQFQVVEEVLKKIDIPPPPVKEEFEIVRVFPLQYADAEAVAENLREIFREGGPSDADAGGRRSSRSSRGYPPPEPPPPGGETPKPTVRLSIRITPNREQRCIVVSGNKANIERVEKLIAELEKVIPVNPASTVIRTFEIRNGVASEIAATLNKLFEGRTDDPSSSAAASASSPTTSSTSSDRESRERSNPYIVRTESSGGSSTDSGRSYYSRRYRSGSGRSAIGDARSNRLIVTAPAADFVYLEKLIQDLDAKIPGLSDNEGVGVITVPRGRNAEVILKQAMEIFEATRRIEQSEPKK